MILMRKVGLFRKFTILLVAMLSACTSLKPRGPSLAQKDVEALLPTNTEERPAWAEDIIAALDQIDRSVTPERVCAVVAVIAQESGFRIDPPVKDLPAIVRRGLEKKFEKLGPLAGTFVDAILLTKAPGTRESFKKRISKLKTESDLDRLFRDIEGSIRERFPGPLMFASLVSKLMGKGWLEDFNPVTTLGPMQVKVAYAKGLPGLKHLSDGELRERLYSRRDGVRAGVARLLDYEAKYDDVLFRFADYNAGVYSSRNAAFQMQISKILGDKLVFDGDLLAYRSDGQVADEPTDSLRAILAFGKKHPVSERTARRAANLEKTSEFEETDLWSQVREAYEKKTGHNPPYAIVPEVTLTSPKMSSSRTTGWFANSVKKRYEECRRRLPTAPPGA